MVYYEWGNLKLAKKSWIICKKQKKLHFTFFDGGLSQQSQCSYEKAPLLDSLELKIAARLEYKLSSQKFPSLLNIFCRLEKLLSTTTVVGMG